MSPSTMLRVKMSLRRTLPRWLWNFSNRLKIGCLFQTDTFFALQLEPEDAEAIYEFYKEDFLMFGYSAQEFLTWYFGETFELWPRGVQCCQILNLSRNGSGVLLSPFRYQIVSQRENQYYVQGITLKWTVWIDIGLVAQIACLFTAQQQGRLLFLIFLIHLGRILTFLTESANCKKDCTYNMKEH